MLRILSILTFTLLFRADSFEFSITKLLNNSKVLEQENWSYVNIFEKCSSGDNVAVKVKIPLHLSSEYSDINIFFANDNKEILQTSLLRLENFTEIIRGSFFSMPYRLEKTMTGSQIKKNFTENFLTLEVDFPKAWLPEKCTKISASIHKIDGKIYSYYGIRNFDISIRDLMVVEEYRDYKCDSS